MQTYLESGLSAPFNEKWEQLAFYAEECFMLLGKKTEYNREEVEKKRDKYRRL